jgi:hypothetical protein
MPIFPRNAIKKTYPKIHQISFLPGSLGRKLREFVAHSPTNDVFSAEKNPEMKKGFGRSARSARNVVFA